MPILCPICPTPLPNGLRLVRRGLGHREREGQEVRETKRKMLWRQAEENKVLSSNYYPPEPMYIPNHEDQTPTVTNNLIPAPEKSKEVQQDKRGTKTEEDRRIIM